MINPVPKPNCKKQRRAKHNPPPTVEDYCTVCGKPYAALHEIFGGKNRQLSIKYGLQVRLCYEHHQGRYGPHHNKVINDKLKREGQMKFEETHSREDFRRIFGKSYL
jgi:hypothetical protein